MRKCKHCQKMKKEDRYQIQKRKRVNDEFGGFSVDSTYLHSWCVDCQTRSYRKSRGSMNVLDRFAELDTELLAELDRRRGGETPRADWMKHS